MDVYSKLIKDVVINVNQGYSFYFYSKKNIIRLWKTFFTELKI